MVAFKVLRNFYANCSKSVQPLQSVKLIYQPCSRSRAAWSVTSVRGMVVRWDPVRFGSQMGSGEVMVAGWDPVSCCS